jgi:hypothetical protein
MSKRNDSGITEVTTHDLRALLFWSSIGMRHSVGGSYLDIDNILESYAEHIGFKFDKKPIWGADRPKRTAAGKR